ncbi:MAG TPA: ferritin-like domain-containing protein [Tepidisphaeraceae bacterium]|nr:ferritin-like domain-containing protein [Tepidisphaeraceae bacterium]
MDKAQTIEHLNRGIALEYGAVIQYNQYSNVLTGADRRIWRDLFKDMSEGALKHAREVGFRVFSLGGIPTIEHTAIKQATDINEMLENSLEHERALVQAYTDALSHSEDNPAYRNFLEGMIEHEQEEVDEIRMYLKRIERAGATESKTKRMGKTG